MQAKHTPCLRAMWIHSGLKASAKWPKRRREEGSAKEQSMSGPPAQAQERGASNYRTSLYDAEGSAAAVSLFSQPSETRIVVVLCGQIADLEGVPSVLDGGF